LKLSFWSPRIAIAIRREASWAVGRVSYDRSVVEVFRYRVFPAAFDTTYLLLKPAESTWSPEAQQQHETSRSAQIDLLRAAHGEARVEQVVANLVDLGADPWSVLGWHIGLWREIKHAFATCCYYSAATAAGCLGERILNHLLIDLETDIRPPTADSNLIHSQNGPSFAKAIKMLTRWNVLEPEAAKQFDLLRKLRNKLVHFDPTLYQDIRQRSLEATVALRDAIDAQFGLFVQRRLIPNTPGHTFLKKDVEHEPFVRKYVLPLASRVSPNHELRHVGPGFNWEIARNEPVESADDTDEAFARLLQEFS
jgi:hypothetical protein